MAGNEYLIAWGIYSLAIFCNLYFSYWIQALRGVGAIKESQKANVYAKIVQIILSIVGLLMGMGIIALTVAYFISGLLMRIYGKRCLYQYHMIERKIKELSGEVTRAEIKENFIKVWFNAKKVGVACIGAFGITQSTTLVCSAYLGLKETASYGLSLQIITALVGVALIYYQAMRPSLIELKITGHKDKFKKVLSLVVSVYWIFYFAELAAFVFIGMPLVSWWKSNTALPLLMIIFMGVYLFLENNHSLFAGIIEMSNTVPYVIPSVISAVVIVIGEVIVAKYTNFGIYGLMFVQFIVQLSYNNWKWPSVVLKEEKLTIASIFKIGVSEGRLMILSKINR